MWEGAVNSMTTMNECTMMLTKIALRRKSSTFFKVIFVLWRCSAVSFEEEQVRGPPKANLMGEEVVNV